MTDPIESLCNAVEMKAARDLALRNAVLEAAAQVCEARERRAMTRQAQAVCRLCAADIRRLIANPADGALPGLDDLDDVSVHEPQNAPASESMRLPFEFWQLTKIDDGRAILFFTEGQYNEIRIALARAGRGKP